MTDEPYTTICTTNSNWFGKRTATVYAKNGRKICQVPAYPYRTRKEALDLAEQLADVLNKADVHLWR